MHHSHTTCTFWVLLSREWIDLASVRVDQVPILLGWFESGRREGRLSGILEMGISPPLSFSRSTPVTDRHLSPRLSIYGVVYSTLPVAFLHSSIRTHSLLPPDQIEKAGESKIRIDLRAPQKPRATTVSTWPIITPCTFKSSHARKQVSK